MNIRVRKLRKLDVLEHMYYIISDIPLIDSVFLEAFQNTFFIKKIKSTIKSKGSCGVFETQWWLLSVGHGRQEKILPVSWAP